MGAQDSARGTWLKPWRSPFVILTDSSPRRLSSASELKPQKHVPSLHHCVPASAGIAPFPSGSPLQAIAEPEHFLPCPWAPGIICSAANPLPSPPSPVSCQALASSPSASLTAKRHHGSFPRKRKVPGPNVTPTWPGTEDAVLTLLDSAPVNQAGFSLLGSKAGAHR